ncbi:hypothetical protein [Streptomyces coerulescens]|uniref:DUF2116 family Zn-ribbon domain-containing protein n=1 Tax=Streptomyces coerulescens TaxID=29304 RepID=A0ABW0CN71_STRCD
MSDLYWRHSCELNPDPDFDPEAEECGGCVRDQSFDLSSPLWAEESEAPPSDRPEAVTHEGAEGPGRTPVDGFCLECGEPLPEDSHAKRMYCGDKCRKRYDRRHN